MLKLTTAVQKKIPAPPERAGKTAEYVRLETSYLPKGMVQSEEGKYSFEDNYMQGGVSMIVYQLTPGKKQ